MPARTVAKLTLKGSGYHDALLAAVSPEHVPARAAAAR